MVMHDMLIVYRYGSLGLRYYHSVWSGPYLNWPGFAERPNESFWLVPGTYREDT